MSLPEIPLCPPNQCMVLQILVGWICLPGIQRHSHLSYCRMWSLSFPGFVLKIQPSYALIKGKLDFHSQQGRYIIGNFLKYTVIQYVSWDMVRVIFQHGHFLDWCWYVKSICSHWKLLEHKKVRKRRWYRVGLMHQIMLKNGSKQQDLEFRPRRRTTYSPSTSCLFLGDTEFGSWCQYHFDSQGGLTESSDVHKCA